MTDFLATHLTLIAWVVVGGMGIFSVTLITSLLIILLMISIRGLNINIGASFALDTIIKPHIEIFSEPKKINDPIEQSSRSAPRLVAPVQSQPEPLAEQIVSDPFPPNRVYRHCDICLEPMPRFTGYHHVEQKRFLCRKCQSDLGYPVRDHDEGSDRK